MSRVLGAAGMLVWAGSALLLSQWGRLARPTLVERLRPFHPGGGAPGHRAAPGSLASLVDVLGPLVRRSGDRLAAALGAAEGAERRLRRVHSPLSAASFRLRQAAGSAAGALAGATVSLVTASPPALAGFLVLGAPVLVFLVFEQRLSRRSEEWQRRTAEEFPVVAEQLAMLLNAGFSVGGALNRMASRARGCVALDLDRVVNRVQQGLSESAALEEWAETVGVESVRRLVALLSVHSEAADLGRLVSAEARAARRDLHRRTVEHIERRSQQVWVPVTVATLVPGAVLLAVPFVAALRMFANA